MAAICVGLDACALIAKQDQLVTRFVGAVSETLGLATAFFTFTDNFRILAEILNHSLVKDIQRSIPQPVVSVFFAVANNPTFDLVDLFKASVDHDSRENFAANATRAVRHDWFSFR